MYDKIIEKLNLSVITNLFETKETDSLLRKFYFTAKIIPMLILIAALVYVGVYAGQYHVEYLDAISLDKTVNIIFLTGLLSPIFSFKIKSIEMKIENKDFHIAFLNIIVLFVAYAIILHFLFLTALLLISLRVKKVYKIKFLKTLAIIDFWDIARTCKVSILMIFINLLVLFSALSLF